MVNCPVCGHEVDWITAGQAESLLHVSQTRITQFIKEGRLPGAIKHRPNFAMQPLWKIPISSVLALRTMRIEEGIQDV